MDTAVQMFDDGAAALLHTLSAHGLTHVLPPMGGPFYACPLCFGLFGRDDLAALTLEHVPPRSLGGRKMVLTCAPCNHTHGSVFDAQAERRETDHDFVAGRTRDRDLPVDIAVGQLVVHGRVRDAGDALVLSVSPAPKANRPDDLVEMTRRLEGWATSGTVAAPLGFRLARPVALPRARLSWVRAAYLAGFSALGWQYALLDVLHPLRAQLADPAAELLPPLSLLDSAAATDRRRLLDVREPAPLRGLAVTMGRHTVLLPSIGDPQPFTAIAAALAAQPAGVRLVGESIAWPAQPRYALDR